jgi:hypothetical protein
VPGGPRPYHFITVPEDASLVLRSIATVVSFGWAVIPLRARSGEHEWGTSLFSRAGGYALPIKDVVRLAAGFALGDVIPVDLSVRQRRG